MTTPEKPKPRTISAKNIRFPKEAYTKGAPEAPPIGGLLYVIAGLLVLGCVGGTMQLFQYVLGGEGSVSPDVLGASIQAISSGVTLSLYVWATTLFFKKSRRFPIWYAAALLANCIAGALLYVFIPQDPVTTEQQMQGLMGASLMSMLLIYYLFTAQRIKDTFINK